MIKFPFTGWSQPGILTIIGSLRKQLATQKQYNQCFRWDFVNLLRHVQTSPPHWLLYESAQSNYITSFYGAISSGTAFILPWHDYYTVWRQNVCHRRRTCRIIMQRCQFSSQRSKKPEGIRQFLLSANNFPLQNRIYVLLKDNAESDVRINSVVFLVSIPSFLNRVSSSAYTSLLLNFLSR